MSRCGFISILGGCHRVARRGAAATTAVVGHLDATNTALDPTAAEPKR